MNKPKKSVQPLEGEGSYSATRRYNQHLGDAVTSGDLEAVAEEARRALEGAEGTEVERAAEEPRRGSRGRENAPSGRPKVRK